MRVELHPCYVLHGRKYRETSLILDIFSAEFGRLRLVARGGRKEKNNKRALMQVGRPVNMAWTIRKEMGTLTAIEPAGPPWHLAGRLLLAVFYMNELLVRLLHQHEPHGGLFSAYEAALAALANQADEEAVLRIFEKRLLAALGYGLVLATDSDGNAIQRLGDYQYHLQTGPVQCRPGSDNIVSCTGKTLLALADEDLADADSRRQAKRLMRYVLGDLLGDKKLASRVLYQAYLHNRSPHDQPAG